MPGDFDKLFGDDWPPQESEMDGGLSPLRGRPEDGGEMIGPLMPFSSDSFPSDASPSDSFSADPFYTSETENRAPRSLNEKEVKVMGVFSSQEQGGLPQHFVLLRDNKGRKIFIWVGQFEAWAIASAVEGEAPDRPLTHDLIKQFLERMEANVERIIIDDLWHETFYAKIGIVKSSGETLELDARPSDAVALALRVHAPIYMAEEVIVAAMRPE